MIAIQKIFCMEATRTLTSSHHCACLQQKCQGTSYSQNDSLSHREPWLLEILPASSLDLFLVSTLMITGLLEDNSFVFFLFLVINIYSFLARIMHVHFRNMVNTNKERKITHLSQVYMCIYVTYKGTPVSQNMIFPYYFVIFSHFVSHQKLIFVFFFLQISKALRLKARDL